MPGGGGYLCSSRLENSAMDWEYYTHAGDLMAGNLLLGKLSLSAVISTFYIVCRAHKCTGYDAAQF